MKNKTAKYIKGLSLSRNTTYHIYSGPHGLVHTTGSMEYMDNDFEIIISFKVGDEIPEGDYLINSINFQMNNNEG